MLLYIGVNVFYDIHKLPDISSISFPILMQTLTYFSSFIKKFNKFKYNHKYT